LVVVNISDSRGVPVAFDNPDGPGKDPWMAAKNRGFAAFFEIYALHGTSLAEVLRLEFGLLVCRLKIY